VQDHCKEGIPNEVYLLKLEWYAKKVVISYLVCKKCEKQKCYMKENRGQEVISRRQLEKLK